MEKIMSYMYFLPEWMFNRKQIRQIRRRGWTWYQGIKARTYRRKLFFWNRDYWKIKRNA